MFDKKFIQVFLYIRINSANQNSRRLKYCNKLINVVNFMFWILPSYVYGVPHDFKLMLEIPFYSHRFGHNAKIVHFSGAVKPWSSSSWEDDKPSQLMEQFVSLWWKEYLNHLMSPPPAKPFRQNWVKAQEVWTFHWPGFSRMASR